MARFSKGFHGSRASIRWFFPRLLPTIWRGVVGRRRYQTEHFTRRGFDGHDTADFPFQQAFAQLLEFDVQTEPQVLASHRSLVELAVHVVALNTSACVAQQYLNTFLASQLLLVRTFHAQFSDKVAGDIVVIFFHVRLGHFCNIT